MVTGNLRRLGPDRVRDVVEERPGEHGLTRRRCARAAALPLVRLPSRGRSAAGPAGLWSAATVAHGRRIAPRRGLCRWRVAATERHTTHYAKSRGT